MNYMFNGLHPTIAPLAFAGFYIYEVRYSCL